MSIILSLQEYFINGIIGYTGFSGWISFAQQNSLEIHPSFEHQILLRSSIPWYRGTTILAQAATTKSRSLGGSHNRNVFSYSYGGEKSKIKVLWELVSGEASVPDLQMAAFSPHMTFPLYTDRETPLVSLLYLSGHQLYQIKVSLLWLI